MTGMAWRGLLLGGLLSGCASLPQHEARIEAGTVTLVLRAPDAANVQLAASINQFAPLPARREQDGVWVVRGLANVDFQYFYLVDGLVALPDCRIKVSDDFGSVNCRHLP
jgi:hypothetical protein